MVEVPLIERERRRDSKVGGSRVGFQGDCERAGIARNTVRGIDARRGSGASSSRSPRDQNR
jgi:hypothetical protein